MSYLPQPPRAWSRVQQIPYCTDPIDTSSTLYNPLTNSTITPANANLFNQILYKANILQYKNNSSNLSKNQRFAQIAKGKWVGKKAYGTQGITYTNPNTSGLYRANAFAISPNTIPGFVNNVSGPYQTGIPNPNGCPNDDTILTQGNLICNTLANPCTNKIIKRYTVKKWHSITASNVPGFSNPNVIKELYWDNRIQTYLPRVRRTMNNSGNKWPQNYNSFVSACLPTSNLGNVLDDVANKVDAKTDTTTTNTLSIDLTNTIQFKQIMSLLNSSQISLENGNNVTVDSFLSQLVPLVNSLSDYVISLEPRTNNQTSVVPSNNNSNRMVSSSTESGELNQLNNQLVDQLNLLITNDSIQGNNNSNRMVSSSTESGELNQLNNQLVDQLNLLITNDSIQGNNNDIYTKMNEIYTIRDVVNTLNSDILSKSLEGVLGRLYENVGKDIKEYTSKYSLGEDLTDVFTYTVYRTLSVELFKESFPSSPNYTYIYDLIVSCLEGLYKSVIRDREYNAEIKTLHRIIDDLKNISSGHLLDASATVDAVALVRPEIKVYVSRYGFPEGGVFESDKLATIIAELAVSPQTPPQ
jgi:hypothetical protein